jgi:hypothetical protein
VPSSRIGHGIALAEAVAEAQGDEAPALIEAVEVVVRAVDDALFEMRLLKASRTLTLITPLPFMIFFRMPMSRNAKPDTSDCTVLIAGEVVAGQFQVHIGRQLEFRGEPGGQFLAGEIEGLFLEGSLPTIEEADVEVSA